MAGEDNIQTGSVNALPVVLVGLLALGLGALLFKKLRAQAESPSEIEAAPAPSASRKTVQAPPKNSSSIKLPGTSPGKSGGILLAAIKAGTSQPINWTTIDVDGMKVEVASDAMKAKVPDGTVLRLPMSYSENIVAAKALAAQGLDVIVPNQKIADAIFAQANVKGQYNSPLRTKEDLKLMETIDVSKKLNADIDRQFAGKTGLFAGPWKHWLIDEGVVVGKRAVNYGAWNPAYPDSAGHTACSGVPCIQGRGHAHGYNQADLSQLVVFVKRFAKDSSGNRVDLLDWMERQGVPAQVTSEFRNPSIAAVA